MFDRGPGAFRPFTVVERIFASNAFSPAIDAVAVGGQQKDSAAERALEARLEKVNERHLNFAEGDGCNFHQCQNLLPDLSAARDVASYELTVETVAGNVFVSDRISLGCGIHPCLLPPPQQKLAAALRMAFIA